MCTKIQFTYVNWMTQLLFPFIYVERRMSCAWWFLVIIEDEFRFWKCWLPVYVFSNCLLNIHIGCVVGVVDFVVSFSLSCSFYQQCCLSVTYTYYITFWEHVDWIAIILLRIRHFHPYNKLKTIYTIKAH